MFFLLILNNPIFFTPGPRSTKDIHSILLNNEYTYFSRLTQLARQVAVAEMSYQLYKEATVLAFDAIRKEIS